MPPETPAPLIFMSYATPDRERVLPLYEYLSGKGFDVWIDFLRIRPGQSWDFEIRRALDKSTIVIAFVSNVSVDRRGYLQRELKFSIEKLQEKISGDIFIIPVLLDDDTRYPSDLEKLQFAKASSETYLTDVEAAVRMQLTTLGESVAAVQTDSHISWSRVTRKEVWEGIPGYELEHERLTLSSDKYPDVGVINDFLRGVVSRWVLGMKATRFDQEPDRFNLGQATESRSHTLDVHFRDPTIIGRVISIPLVVSWYYAGAAHGGGETAVHSFCLSPVVWIENLAQIFIDSDYGLKSVQETVRPILYESLGADDSVDVDWLRRGTDDWEAFGSFHFEENGITFYFQEYQVAAYAYGPQQASVEYKKIIKSIKPSYVSALEIEKFLWET